MKRTFWWFLGALGLTLLPSVAPAAAPAPAPGEIKVLFTACSPAHPAGPGLYVADADFSNPVRLHTAVPTEDTFFSGCESGAWSADGRRVILSRNESIELLELKVLGEVPDQQPVPVVGADGQAVAGYSPCWSPDEQWITFHDDSKGLVLMRIDGTGYRVLVPFADRFTRIREPAFAPDGQSIVFRAGLTVPSHLYLVTNLYGSGPAEVTQLTQGDYQDSWPHFSPDGTKVMFTRAKQPNRNALYGDVWTVDLQTGAEKCVVDTTKLDQAIGLGWCPFDNKIYYGGSVNGAGAVFRISEDGTTETFRTEIVPNGRVTWAYVGAWVDSAQALPGEQVKVQIGVQQGFELAEALGRLHVGDLIPLGASRGRSIPHWNFLDPVLSGDVLSLHAFAGNPETDNVSGPAHLFSLWLGVPSAAQPDEVRVVSFSEFLLADKLGQPQPNFPLSGTVRTLPFAALRLEIRNPEALTEGNHEVEIVVTALDRNGQVMTGCNAPVKLGYSATWKDRERDVSGPILDPLSPARVTLQQGRWRGRVTVPMGPLPGSRLLASWGDIAGYSAYLAPPDRG